MPGNWKNTVSLNVNVQDEAFAVTLGDHGFCTITQGCDRWIVFKALGARDISASVELIQQSASEHDNVNKRRFALIGRTGLYGGETIGSDVVGGGSAPAGEHEGIAKQRSVLGGDVTVFVGLPDF
mgnify:CR=1 FL=1